MIDMPLRQKWRSDRIIIYIERRTLIRECLTSCLARCYEHEVVVPFASIGDCSEAGVHPDTVMLILYGLDRAPDEHADLDEDLNQLARVFPSAPVVLLSDSDSDVHVLRAIKGGVRGFISTDSTLDVAVGATHVVGAGGSFAPESCLSALRTERRDDLALGPRPSDQFTPRQIDVLKRLRQGKANRVIAHELEISESRVKAHIRNLMQKLNATNRTQVAFLTKEFFAAQRSNDPKERRGGS
jgi:DNA-binding NarL/FixJ family response regulator